jgi:hypothetical protein
MGDDSQERFARLKGVLIIQWIALLIGLALPIVPSKTGGDSSPAEWFFEDPSYLHEVLVVCLATNLLFGVLILSAVGLVWVKRRRGGGEG